MQLDQGQPINWENHLPQGGLSGRRELVLLDLNPDKQRRLHMLEISSSVTCRRSQCFVLLPLLRVGG